MVDLMLLSDYHISQMIEHGELVIDPYDPDNLQACSIDLRLGSRFMFPDLSDETSYPHEHMLCLPDKVRVHAVTLERLKLPNYIAGIVSTRSSLDRMGVVTNGGSVLVNPGFEGTLTLELFNYGTDDVYLQIGSRVCTIRFEWLSSPAMKPYKGHYQSQQDVTPVNYEALS
jgi:dCTP deaminase